MIMSDLTFIPSAAVSSEAFSTDVLAFMPWNISRLESDIRVLPGYLPVIASAGPSSMLAFGIIDSTVSNLFFLSASAPE